ncbi:MAG: polysaccharide export protein [Candidatus Omnitrophica bacterium]|nr:polysaccharide export protein [Candidatus Omnitrophota bacterium]
MGFVRSSFFILGLPLLIFYLTGILFSPLSPAESAKGTGFFQLQPGDRLEIEVYREEDLSGVYEIDPSGSLTFPLVGKMKVAGLRVNELLERLNWNLRKYLVDPQVSISRAEGTIKSISVLGQVKKPGAFDYAPGLTVMRVVSQAGGFERGANKRKIRVVRMVNGEKKSIVVNGSAIINGEEEDPAVEPGDMIFVSEAIF